MQRRVYQVQVIEDGDDGSVLWQVFLAFYLEANYASKRPLNYATGDFKRYLGSWPSQSSFDYSAFDWKFVERGMSSLLLGGVEMSVSLEQVRNLSSLLSWSVCLIL